MEKSQGLYPWPEILFCELSPKLWLIPDGSERFVTWARSHPAGQMFRVSINIHIY